MEQTFMALIIASYTIGPLCGLIWLGMIRENQKRLRMIDRLIMMSHLQRIAKGRR